MYITSRTVPLKKVLQSLFFASLAPKRFFEIS